MSSQPQFQQRDKNILDDSQISLSTLWGTPSKYATMKFLFFNNNPRIVVYTNDKDAPAEEQKIEAKISLDVFFTMLAVLDEIIEGPADTQKVISNKGYTFFGGKRSDEPQPQSEIRIGKDKEGAIWIAVTQAKRPKIQFYFELNSRFHEIRHADGTPYTKAEASLVMARAKRTELQLLISAVAAGTWKQPEAKEPKSQGGGYRQQGGGSTVPGKPDDDLPF